jgi:CBS domain-containing membrane protein
MTAFLRRARHCACSALASAGGQRLTDSVSVRDVMTRDVVTLDRNDKLLVADDLMRLGRIRHLPVVDEEGRLAGIVSQRDLFHSGLIKALGYGTHAQRQALDMVVVKEAMRSEVVTTTPDTPLREAARLMLERKIGCLVVLDDSRLAGILTESDFVKLAAGR